MKVVDRIYQDRMRRRQLLKAAGVGGTGLTAAALVGCGDDDDKPKSSSNTGITLPTSAATTAASATAQVKRGGQLKMSIALTANDVWDPHVSLTSAGLIWEMIGNQAVHLKTDGSALVPELVEKWETPGDGTQIILHLRKGVNWHNKPPTNGRAFVADDLAFNINRITGKLNPDKAALFQRRSTLPNLDNATATDESTVVVKLTAPHSGFMNGLADFRYNIAPRDFIEKNSADFADATKLVGTGPFTIDSWEISQKALFKAVPNWDQGHPYLDSILMLQFADRLSLQASFVKGDIDFIESPNKAEREAIKKLTDNYREEKWIHDVWQHFRFNLARKPFDDPRVRRAIFLAIDYKSLCDEFYGPGYWDWAAPLTGFAEAIPSAELAKTAGYNPDTKEADRKNAVALMTAAGYPKGVPFKFLPSSNVTTSGPFDATIRAQDDLKRVWPDAAVGIDPPADAVAFSQRQVNADFDVISYGIGGYSDAVTELEAHYGSKGSRNYGKFSNADVDALILKASSELDFNKRKQTLLDVQKILIEQMPIIRFAVGAAVVWYRKDVRGAEKYGLVTGTSSYDTRFNLKNVWLDRA